MRWHSFDSVAPKYICYGLPILNTCLQCHAFFSMNKQKGFLICLDAHTDINTKLLQQLLFCWTVKSPESHKDIISSLVLRTGKVSACHCSEVKFISCSLKDTHKMDTFSNFPSTWEWDIVGLCVPNSGFLATGNFEKVDIPLYVSQWKPSFLKKNLCVCLSIHPSLDVKRKRWPCICDLGQRRNP